MTFIGHLNVSEEFLCIFIELRFYYQPGFRWLRIISIPGTTASFGFLCIGMTAILWTQLTESDPPMEKLIETTTRATLSSAYHAWMASQSWPALQ